MLDELRDGNVHANLGLACVVSLRDRVYEQVVGMPFTLHVLF